MTAHASKGQGMSHEERRRVARLIRETDAEWVVLIGSWARGTQTPGTSDVDILVGSPPRARPGPTEKIHAIYLDSDQIMARASIGDDVALWCLTFGIPLSGARRWRALRDAVLSSSPKPDARRKFELASRMLRYSEELLKMGDVEAAQEELQIAAEHLARGHLILSDVFPLSRPEIPQQLVSVGLDNLSSLIQQLSREDLDEDSLHDAIQVGQDFLTHGLGRWTRAVGNAVNGTDGIEGPPNNQEVRLAAERLRRAHEDYERFIGRSVTGVESQTHSLAELTAAQVRVQDAEENLRRLLHPEQSRPRT